MKFASHFRTNKLQKVFSRELVSACDGDKQFIGRLKSGTIEFTYEYDVLHV